MKDDILKEEEKRRPLTGLAPTMSQYNLSPEETRKRQLQKFSYEELLEDPDMVIDPPAEDERPGEGRGPETIEDKDEPEEDVPRCLVLNPEIDYEAGRNHKGRKKAKFIVTKNLDFQGGSKGNFKHYEQKLLDMDFCNFDEFYDAIEECFGPEWQDKVLPVHGMDYYFRDEHEIAYKLLKIHEEGDLCPTKTGEEPILDPDHKPETEKPSCKELEEEWNELSKQLVRINVLEDIFTAENEERAAKDQEPLEQLPLWIIEPQEFERLKTEVPARIEEIGREAIKLDCPKFELSYYPADEYYRIVDEIKEKKPKKPDDLPDEPIKVHVGPGRFTTREDLDVRSGANTPSVHINYGKNYMIYGHEDPLHLYPEDGIRFNLDKKLRELFGYNSWEEYREENKEDLTKDVIIMRNGKKEWGKQEKLQPGDITISAPTLWPIHVAMALKEFSNSRKPEQYWPTLFIDSAEQKSKIMEVIEKFDIGVPDNMGFMGPEEQEILERRLGLSGIGDGFSSSEGGPGAFETGVRNPFEGLREGGQEALNKIFSIEKNRNQGASGIHVVDTNGKPLYWVERDPEQPDKTFIITSDVSVLDRASSAGIEYEKVSIDPGTEIKMAGTIPIKAGPIIIRKLITRLPGGVRPQLPEDFDYGEDPIPNVEIELGNVYFLPQGWSTPGRKGRELTEAEDILFKRLGIKNSEFQEEGYIYKMNLETKETNVFKPPNYGDYKEIDDPIHEAYFDWIGRQEDPMADIFASQDPPKDRPPEETVDVEPGVFDKVRTPATATGIDPKWIHGMMMTESRGNCNARAFNNQILKLIYAKACGDGDECTKKEKRSSKLRTKMFGDDETKIKAIKEALEGAGLIKNGPTTGDHKNDPNSQFHKAFKIAPKAAIAVTAWGTYQVLGLYRQMLMDAEPSEFYAGWFEGDDRDRCDLSAALIEEWVEKKGQDFIDQANKAAETNNISDWYESIRPYHGRASCSNKSEDKGEIFSSGEISSKGKWFQDDEGVYGEPGKKYCRSNLVYALRTKKFSTEWEGKVPSAVAPKPPEGIPGGAELPDAGRVGERPEEQLPPEVEAPEPIPGEEEETPGPLVRIEKPISDEEINEELGLVRFNGFKRVRSASHSVAFAQPIVIDFLKGLANINDGHWRIGDMSGPQGGKIVLHNSHQTGLDLDVAIPMAKDKFTIFTKDEEPDRFTRLSGRRGRAAKRGWDYSKGRIVNMEQIKKIIDLVGTVIDAGAILIFVDKSIGNYIKEIIRNKLDDGSLDSKYKIAGKQHGGLIQHWPNHEDHFHIRFPLSKEECSGPKCNSTYLRNWVTPDKMLAYKKEHHEEIRHQHENLNLSNIFDLINEALGDKK